MTLAKPKLANAIAEGLDYAFLSSLYTEVKELRMAINERINSELCPTIPIYIDEKFIHRQEEFELSKQLAVASDFIDKLIKSKLVIVIFSKIEQSRKTDHGYQFANTMVSFWEIELFYAAILKKPIYVVIEKGFEYQERPFLYHVLEILKLSSVKIYEEERDDIVSRVEGILIFQEETKPIVVKRYLSELDWKRRTPLDDSTLLYDTSLGSHNWFLQYGEINEDIIYDNIANIDNESNYQLKIARLYLSYRELLKIDFTNKKYERFLPAWNIHSEKMAAAMSWYGTHGHQVLGVINHLIDLARVRHIIKERKLEQFSPTDVEFPAGGLASAYYSLANIGQRQNLQKAIYYTNIGLKQQTERKDGLWAIRGSCYMRQLKLWKAVNDYELALKERSRLNADQNSIADSMSELSLGYFMTGRIFKAIDLYKQAEKMFTRDDGFKIRSLRKGALMYKILGRRGKSRELIDRAKSLSRHNNVFDQLRQLS